MIQGAACHWQYIFLKKPGIFNHLDNIIRNIIVRASGYFVDALSTATGTLKNFTCLYVTGYRLLVIANNASDPDWIRCRWFICAIYWFSSATTTGTFGISDSDGKSNFFLSSMFGCCARSFKIISCNSIDPIIWSNFLTSNGIT